ncbi:hypothetical protein PG994_010773 [Apiospora phragmitis]|uniref:Uncharacterized protein n=1 Tax=Apiospora phragmitis TaxID=2905665 RepID=A0ABR1TR26_9PEZI
MTPSSSLSQRALTTVPITSHLPVTYVFQLGPVPASLEASVVFSTKGVRDGYLGYGLERYVVDCPAARSPENDACRALRLYPAEVGVDASTARCDQTLVVARSKTMDTTTVTTSLDKCYIDQHFAPVVVTAGEEKLDVKWMNGDLPPAYILDWADDLSSMSCPPRPTLTSGQMPILPGFNAPRTTTSLPITSKTEGVATAATTTSVASQGASPPLSPTPTTAATPTTGQSNGSRLQGAQYAFVGLSTSMSILWVLIQWTTGY